MAAPNLISPWYNTNERLQSIYGKSNYHHCYDGFTMVLGNPAGSNSVYKINAFSIAWDNIYAVNYCDILITNNNGSPVKGGGGNCYLYDRLERETFQNRWDIAITFPGSNKINRDDYVPIAAHNLSRRWKIISKDEMIYLQEGDQLHVYIEGAEGCATISYEGVNGKTVV